MRRAWRGGPPPAGAACLRRELKVGAFRGWAPSPGQRPHEGEERPAILRWRGAHGRWAARNGGLLTHRESPGLFSSPHRREIQGQLAGGHSPASTQGRRAGKEMPLQCPLCPSSSQLKCPLSQEALRDCGAHIILFFSSHVLGLCAPTRQSKAHSRGVNPLP